MLEIYSQSCIDIIGIDYVKYTAKAELTYRDRLCLKIHS